MATTENRNDIQPAMVLDLFMTWIGGLLGDSIKNKNGGRRGKPTLHGGFAATVEKFQLRLNARDITNSQAHAILEAMESDYYARLLELDAISPPARRVDLTGLDPDRLVNVLLEAAHAQLDALLAMSPKTNRSSNAGERPSKDPRDNLLPFVANSLPRLERACQDRDLDPARLADFIKLRYGRRSNVSGVIAAIAADLQSMAEGPRLNIGALGGAATDGGDDADQVAESSDAAPADAGVTDEVAPAAEADTADVAVGTDNTDAGEAADVVTDDPAAPEVLKGEPPQPPGATEEPPAPPPERPAAATNGDEPDDGEGKRASRRGGVLSRRGK